MLNNALCPFRSLFCCPQILGDSSRNGTAGEYSIFGISISCLVSLLYSNYDFHVLGREVPWASSVRAKRRDINNATVTPHQTNY